MVVAEGKGDTTTSHGSPMEQQNSYRPPWTTPYIIGVGGTSGSGKTSVASKIVSSIDVPWTVLISLDNFYKPLDKRDRELAFNNNYDFDEPNAIDLDLAYRCISDLKNGKKAQLPVYSFVNHNRVPGKSITIYGATVIVLEGIYALYDKRLLDLMDLKVYVDADLDVCLARRLSRDIVSRGRDMDGCIRQWQRFVKPNAVKYVKPTMQFADAIIPSINDNRVAVQLLINHINSKLEIKSEQHIRKLVKLGYSDSKPIRDHEKVHELEPTNQVQAIKTMLVTKDLSRDDFIFYFDRMAMILLSNVLNNVSYRNDYELVTPEGIKMENMTTIDFDKIAAINIIRSGDCFVSSLRKTIPNIAIGKVLIQSDSHSGEPQLHCEFLPPNIAENYTKIILTQGQIISGAAMIMAIQVLLDHDVTFDKIIVMVHLATEKGIRRILNAFQNKVDIFIGILVDNKNLKYNKWATTRFIDSNYFGCP
ncbi:uridine kinase URK1 NDAI_0K01700 [Naumovozyma dairenensis CBS 421]|uniref:Uridine kinase n=1 Tax=Naumovozyma dairenensis (strain ATCC 10597 / BCRC 20456 / CBS 421 / NBRC 0211 / NRRL Y-12639) TaxID=1071378 RepID=G0WHV0_NAUDC|nr:hypothetical protein NDAI_0K01700 [Naumovozyma dairenensis CBS 421]CCD27361.1 hypothetical protein NDAI_0K01700 [Naumovozyma dairenensis CBS 421]